MALKGASMRKRKIGVLLGLGAILIGAALLQNSRAPQVLTPEIPAPMPPRHTVGTRLRQFGEAARGRYAADFRRAGVSPKKLAMVAFKQEHRLEIYAQNSAGEWTWVRNYPILRAPRTLGPKLREGDNMVPEGFYDVESFNPNSAYHVSLRVSYPSARDREIAEREKRENLGGNIMIHGGAASIGCLAMGDESAEELFTMTADAGRENVKLVFCPLDWRRQNLPDDPNRPQWVGERYAQLRDWVRALPKP